MKAGYMEYADDMTRVLRHLGLKVDDPELYRMALTHSSYVNEHRDCTGHNERLEFLGDAVLNMLVSEHLYRRGSEGSGPALREGRLTRLRAKLVCEPSLARVAAEMGLGDLLRMGRGEEASGGRSKPSVLADALEALVAAAYLDGGLDEARGFVVGRILPSLEREPEVLPIDYKTKLQELMQARGAPSRPVYRITDISGPDHDRTYRAEVECDGRMLGSGVGRSKRRAEQEAAREALSRLEERSADRP